MPNACSSAARLATRPPIATSCRPTATAASRRRAEHGRALGEAAHHAGDPLRQAPRDARRARPARRPTARRPAPPSVTPATQRRPPRPSGSGMTMVAIATTTKVTSPLTTFQAPTLPAIRRPASRGRGRVAADRGVADDVAELGRQQLAGAVADPVGALHVAALDAAHAAGAQPDAPDEPRGDLADRVDRRPRRTTQGQLTAAKASASAPGRMACGGAPRRRAPSAGRRPP